MCFSASVSFAASAVLIPAGLYCLKVTASNEAYWPLAFVPLAFGLQQGFEGVVWLGINSNDLELMRLGALAFLFFSHCFWLIWPSFIALSLEDNPTIKALCKFCLVVGILYGAVLYLPLLINANWLSVAVVHRSIEYQAHFVGDAVPVLLSRLLYASTILVPLFISSRLEIRIWGILITLFALISFLLFNYAFVSVWCFFAALLSFYIIHVILKATPTWSEQP